MEKKTEYRFNIILNPGDPMHKTAINALNNQGRHKSQFVVNAIVHYIMNDESASKAVVPDTDEIRTICREILSEMLDSIPRAPRAPIPLVQEAEIELDTESAEQDIDFGAIADTLNGFRKK